MAPPALRGGIWVGAAALAATVLVLVATHGRRPDSSLVRFEPAGVMAETPPERVTEVVVTRETQRWRFTRGDGGAWIGPRDLPSGGADVARAIESGLRLLHASAPQRVLARDELSTTPLAELGLDPPRYVVAIGPAAAPALTVEFGGRNAQGLAQYARVRGRDEVLLLPAFVGEPWDTIGRAPGPSR